MLIPRGCGKNCAPDPHTRLLLVTFLTVNYDGLRSRNEDNET